MVFEIGLQSGYNCPMAGYGIGYGGGGFSLFWLLSLVLAAGVAALITYLLLKGRDSDAPRHKKIVR